MLLKLNARSVTVAAHLSGLFSFRIKPSLTSFCQKSPDPTEI